MSKRPNIIFMQCDSMDGRAMDPMGLAALKGVTPAMSSMAQEGTLFENTYCTNPVCCCSRSSMWSGQYTFNCHAWNNYKGLPKNQPNFKTELEKNGYTAGVFGKTDIISGQHSIRARVTAWTRSAKIDRPQYNMEVPHVADTYEKRVHASDWKNLDIAIDWLNGAAKNEEPFFMYLGVNAPHPRFHTSKYYMDRIDMDAIEIPPEDEYSHPVMEYQRKAKAWTHGLDADTKRFVRAIYYAMIAETDEMLGTLLTEIEKLGIGDDTYIVFTGDHGECGLEHDLFYKMNMYEPAMRVPLLINGPDVKKGQRVSRMTSLVDIFPTLMSMAGVDSVVKQDGNSLISELRGEKSALANVAFGEFHDGPVSTGTSMVRKDNWKYITFVGDEPLLFDLENDPWEVKNLAPEMPEKAAEMDALMRSIVDYEAIDRLVKEYDRDSFRVWRQEQIAQGTYRDNMALVYSGFDKIAPENIMPWTDEEEQIIIDWLEEYPV